MKTEFFANQEHQKRQQVAPCKKSISLIQD